MKLPVYKLSRPIMRNSGKIMALSLYQKS